LNEPVGSTCTIVAGLYQRAGLTPTRPFALALAAGLKLVVEDKAYDKLVVIRPITPMGKDLGFTPGSVQEKISVWMGAIYDNLDVLIGDNTRMSIEGVIESGLIELVPPTYIRGRSLRSSYIVVDESQSFTLHEAKTLLTRVGEDSKIVFTGDIKQIDNPRVSAEDNGLTEIIEAFKKEVMAGHIDLRQCERSTLAARAAELL
jgi:PhoH-like ATPase